MHPQHAQVTGQAQQLRSKLADLQRVSQQLDGAWRMQALRDSSSKTDIWKRKVEQVVEEADDLRAALDKHTHRVRRCVCGHALLLRCAHKAINLTTCSRIPGGKQRRKTGRSCSRVQMPMGQLAGGRA